MTAVGEQRLALHFFPAVPGSYDDVIAPTPHVYGFISINIPDLASLAVIEAKRIG